MFTKREGMSQARPGIDTGKGVTKQQHKDECNINLIMKKYKKTQTLSFVNQHQGEYMEVPDIDFMDAMLAIQKANNMFADMPSELRKKFNNNPGEFMEFVHNPDNGEELYDLGLAERPADYVPSTEPETTTVSENAETAEPSS